jgi:peptide/nickel transport system substrate-binding protein
MNKRVKIAIAVVIAIIVVSVAFVELYHPSKTPIALTDTSQVSAPGSLDPASGFFTTNGPLFTATYQTLTEFNGSSDTQVVPVLAEHIYNQNNQNYTFQIWQNAKFSNNKPVNASAVWFSFYRGIVMGQGPYAADYSNILFNLSNQGITNIFLPWGARAALTNAGYHLTGNITEQYTQAAHDLDAILSNFNYNSTEMKVMEYPYQAIVVNQNGTVTIKTLKPYTFLLQDIAGWWGDILYPAYIDAHGGVEFNTQNSYVNLHGAIGSGPYVIKSVAAGFSTIVLQANPNYWVKPGDGVPAVAQPAHIKTVTIEYALSHTDREEDFDKNISQISLIGPSSFKSMIDSFHVASERNYSLVHSYKVIGAFYISMNVQRSYTDNKYFREALYDALNYTAEEEVYKNNYNGKSMAYAELGPLSPQYGKSYYNPDNFPMPEQNLKYAIQNLTLAGNEMKFYVTLPNGTIIGDRSGTDLSKHNFVLTGIAPSTAIESSQLTIAISSFSKIGLTFTSTLVTESIAGTWDTAKETPHFVDLAWEPDFSDPVGQQLEQIYAKVDGGIGNKAWVDNTTLQNDFKTLDFLNKTVQINDMKSVSRVVYDQYAYMWLPVPDTNYFINPALHGFEFNTFVGYFYNMLYYSGVTGHTAHADYDLVSGIVAMEELKIDVRFLNL